MEFLLLVLGSNQPADFASAVTTTIFAFDQHHHHFNYSKQCKERTSRGGIV
jgi:hypothetical protein